MPNSKQRHSPLKPKAAEAKAAAAQAAYEAAQLGSDRTPDPATTSQSNESDTDSSEVEVENDSSAAQLPHVTATKPLSDYAQEIVAGYASEAAALTIGTYIEDGSPQPGIEIALPLAMLNRHGLVAGATGTGKTRTLQLLAEGLSTAGVPVLSQISRRSYWTTRARRTI